MRLLDIEGHIDVDLDHVALRIEHVHGQRIAVVQAAYLRCTTCFGPTPNVPHGLQAWYRKGQLHDRAELCIGWSAGRDDELVVLVRTGTHEHQLVLERFTNASIC